MKYNYNLALTSPSRSLAHPQMEALYVEVLYTVFHKVGAQQGDKREHTEDLPRYAQAAFHIDPQDHARLQAVAQEEKVGQGLV